MIDTRGWWPPISNNDGELGHATHRPTWDVHTQGYRPRGTHGHLATANADFLQVYYVHSWDVSTTDHTIEQFGELGQAGNHPQSMVN